MMQKKIKIPIKEKKIINRRSTSSKCESKFPINNKQTITKTSNLNTSDFETNPIDSTITSESTTTTDTTKRIYIYRKNMSKQKNSLGLIKQDSKRQIKRLIHCTSLDNLNKNKSTGTLTLSFSAPQTRIAMRTILASNCPGSSGER